MKIKNIFYYLLSFIAFVTLFYIFENANIGGLLYPFSFGLLFALAWSNQKLWIICPSYLISSFLYEFSVNNIISTLCVSVFLVVPFVVHIFVKKKMKIWELGIFAGCGQIGKILIDLISNNFIYYDIASIFVGVLFMYLIINIFDGVLVKGLAYKLTSMELISGGIFLAVVSNGLSFLDISFFSFLKMFVSFVILFVTYCGKRKDGILLSLILGVGTLFASNNPVYIAPFAIWGIAVCLCNKYQKITMPICLMGAECLSGFYFQLYYNFNALNLISLAVACIIFWSIPNKIYEKFRILISNKNNRVAVKDVVNRNREILHNRISCLAETFYQIEKTFIKMSKESFSEDEMKEILMRELKKQVCETCPEKNHCFRSYEREMRMSFEEISEIGFKKGKISLLDIPGFMNSHCKKATSIISSTNTLCNQYKNYTNLVEDVDRSKYLVAEQMGGVANIMKELAKEVKAPIAFDNVREEKIIEELLFNEIVCDDVIVVEKGIHSLEVTVVVRNEDVEKEKLGEIIGKICKVELYIENKVAFRPGWSTLVLKEIPRFDCSFGVSVKNKEGASVSGDCYSVQKIQGDKFMFALCDGMGSVVKANEISENAISLIEDYYKAGFDSELIMSSINKLLSLQKEDSFSAVDICILDLNEGSMNSIKMGSPSSYIINKDNPEIIESNALPLGVVQNSKTTVNKKIIRKGDYVILMTDGVSDSFENDNKIVEYVCSLEIGNPQSISDLILNKALENNKNIAKDDMSVIVVKIF